MGADLVNVQNASTQDVFNMKELLTAYFENDSQQRITLEKLVGAGKVSVAWRILYRSDNNTIQRLVLKHLQEALRYDKDFVQGDDDEEMDDNGLGEDIADGQQEEVNDITKEKNILKILKWAMHIVHMVEIPEDPLKRNIPMRPHRLGHWIYLEWVENGDVNNFISKALAAKVEVVPNRLLWRFWLCMLRMVVAMGWPPEPVGDASPVGGMIERTSTKPVRGIVHNDVNNGNVMFGGFTAGLDEEHDVSPPLKLIDWGEAAEFKGFDGVAESLFDVATVMISIVLLSEDEGIDLGPGSYEVPFQASARAPKIQTTAVSLLPDENGKNPVPFLENDLKAAICTCLAGEESDRPKITTLVDQAVHAIRHRNEQWYANNGHPRPQLESDQNIDAIIKACLLNAPGAG
ncbi:uncharacterized protein JN550_011758 [Neoarthrinium moseri]|uniref:uncharacterized protein n=1 Tax=Neoarthrinium moseri TaxID=1658444 RepID=UPI001FDE34BA|nr:uncharacterized protein JN550_011758 [Neoarthrinium moseri]KAI1859947.1 hypothetical protein JN550_011758 [Neoarthrinium moseri]